MTMACKTNSSTPILFGPHLRVGDRINRFSQDNSIWAFLPRPDSLFLLLVLNSDPIEEPDSPNFIKEIDKKESSKVFINTSCTQSLILRSQISTSNSSHRHLLLSMYSKPFNEPILILSQNREVRGNPSNCK